MANFYCDECKCFMKGGHIPEAHASDCCAKDGSRLVEAKKDKRLEFVDLGDPLAAEAASVIDQIDRTLQFAPKICREAMLATREVLVKVKERG